jgi:hypothetical protein
MFGLHLGDIDQPTDLQNIVISVQGSTLGNGVGGMETRGKEGMKGLTLKVPMGATGIPVRLYGALRHRKYPK